MLFYSAFFGHFGICASDLTPKVESGKGAYLPLYWRLSIRIAGALLVLQQTWKKDGKRALLFFECVLGGNIMFGIFGASAIRDYLYVGWSYLLFGLAVLHQVLSQGRWWLQLEFSSWSMLRHDRSAFRFFWPSSHSLRTLRLRYIQSLFGSILLILAYLPLALLHLLLQHDLWIDYRHRSFQPDQHHLFHDLRDSLHYLHLFRYASFSLLFLCLA